MPKCKKCGTSLHPEQKVCLQCGTHTSLWDGGADKEEKPPVIIPWTAVGIIGGGLLLAIILLGVGLHFRIVPPDQVVSQWTDHVLSRRFNEAKKLTTPAFEATILDQPASAEKSDNYIEFMRNNEADYTLSKPVYNGPNSAVVTISFKGKNGLSLTEQIHLVLEKRAWKIASIE